MYDLRLALIYLFPFKGARVFIIESQRTTVHESQRETVQGSTGEVRDNIKCVQKLTTNLNI